MYTEPPDDGTFEPIVGSEPSPDELEALWEFTVITPDDMFIVDGDTRDVLHAYDLRDGDSLGVWRWKGFEVREAGYVCPDPRCDYDHTDEVEFTLHQWMTTRGGGVELAAWRNGPEIQTFDSASEAMIEAWYEWYNRLWHDDRVEG
jgi:hypothetical protein